MNNHREIHIRLTGLPRDLEEATTQLGKGFKVISRSNPVSNRSSAYNRMYLTAELAAASADTEMLLATLCDDYCHWPREQISLEALEQHCDHCKIAAYITGNNEEE